MLFGTGSVVAAIMAPAVDRRAPGGWAGLMIGLAGAAAILLIGPFTGGTLNPAGPRAFDEVEPDRGRKARSKASATVDRATGGTRTAGDRRRHHREALMRHRFSKRTKE